MSVKAKPRKPVKANVKSRANVKNRSWTAQSDSRAVQAYLEWDLIQDEYGETLKELNVDRDVYQVLAQKVRLQPGISLINYVMDLGLGAFANTFELVLMLLRPRFDIEEIIHFMLRNPDPEPFAKSVVQLADAGLIRFHKLGGNRLFAAMPFTQGQDVSLAEVDEWCQKIWSHLDRTVPGLSAL